MKYIVTGGAGFIGSHITDALLTDGNEVTVIDIFSEPACRVTGSTLHADMLKIVHGDIADIPMLRREFQGADGIFHEAAISSVPQSVSNPLKTHATNVTGTLNVLIAAKETGVRKIVFASSSAVYGNEPSLPKKEEMLPCPESPYAVSKFAGEGYCRAFSKIYPLQYVCLRYFNVYGPRQNPLSEYAAVIPKFITRVLDNAAPIIYGSGEQTRDFIYVKDVVQANISAMNQDVQGTFNIASGSFISVNDLAGLILMTAGKKIRPVYQNKRVGDILDSCADISHAANEFGFRPAYTLERGLAETMEWYKTGRTQ